MSDKYSIIVIPLSSPTYYHNQANTAFLIVLQRKENKPTVIQHISLGIEEEIHSDYNNTD